MIGKIIKFIGILLLINVIFVISITNWEKISGFSGIHDVNDCETLEKCKNTNPINVIFMGKTYQCKTDAISEQRNTKGDNGCECKINGESDYQVHYTC